MMSKESNHLSTIALLQLPNIGRKTVNKFLTSLRNSIMHSNYEDKIQNYSENEYFDSFREFQPSTKLTSNDWIQAFEKAEKIIDISDGLGIQILSIFDNKYPNRLKKIPDPPPILYSQGNIDCSSKMITIAVVGTRNPTIFGEKSAEKIGKLFADLNIPVISGLAEGCDSFVQQGCVDQDGETIAVLAHGLNQIYPRQNERLAEQIISKNGCLLSEYPPGMRPNRFSFVDRDRIQSGLSDQVIVIETGVKGGTMHTVNYCIEQKRILGCLKHPSDFIGLFQSSGNQLLISDKRAFSIYFDYFNKSSFGQKDEHDDTLLSFIKKLETKKHFEENFFAKMNKTFNEFLIFENFSLDIDESKRDPSHKKKPRKSRKKIKSDDLSQKELHTVT